MIKKHIGIFRQVPIDTSDEAVAKHLASTQKNAKIVQDYYRHYAGHVWDVQVRGYVMRGEDNPHPPGYAKSDTNKYVIEHPEEFEDIGWMPNYWHIHGGWSESYCGLGNLGGNRSVTFLHYACGVKTMMHEIGHNLGMHHASTWDGEELVEYGDGSSIMGSQPGLRGLSSPHKILLGLETDREVYKVRESREILLCPLGLPEHGMHDNEYQNIIFDENYKSPRHLSLRKVKGGRYASGLAPEDYIYIQELTHNGHSTRHIPDFRVGSTKSLGGYTVKYVEYKNETARLSITKSGEEAPEAIEIPKGFPTKVPGTSTLPEHSGSWYNSRYVGQGFDIHIKEDLLVFYWYTFNEEDNSRRFYTASGVPGEEFDIYTTNNGTWEDPTKHEKIKVGIGEIYFFDKEHGVFNYMMEEFGRGSISMTPVTLSSNNVNNGSYFQPSRDGEGFTVQFFDHLDVCVAYWFSYGPKEPYSFGAKDWIQKQRWYVCSGTKNLDGTYNMKVYEVLDGRWMWLREQEDLNATDVGDAIMTVVDDDHLKFDFSINAHRVSGAGSYDLQKLF